MNRREWLLGAFALTAVRPQAPVEERSVWGTPVDLNALPEPLGPFEEVSGALDFTALAKHSTLGREFTGLSAVLSADRWHAIESMLVTGVCHVTKQVEGEADEVFRVEGWTVAPWGEEYLLTVDLVRA